MISRSPPSKASPSEVAGLVQEGDICELSLEVSFEAVVAVTWPLALDRANQG
jgi:hypothetical protein